MVVFCSILIYLVDILSLIVRKEASNPPFKNHPPHFQVPPFFKISHPPTLTANRSSHVFLINRNATVNLSSINTVHVKQQNNVGSFIFKCSLKYMLGNVYINNIYARHCFAAETLECFSRLLC